MRTRSTKLSLQRFGTLSVAPKMNSMAFEGVVEEMIAEGGKGFEMAEKIGGSEEKRVKGGKGGQGGVTRSYEGRQRGGHWANVNYNVK